MEGGVIRGTAPHGKQNFLALKLCRLLPLALLLSAMKVKILEWLEATASDTGGRGILFQG